MMKHYFNIFINISYILILFIINHYDDICVSIYVLYTFSVTDSIATLLYMMFSYIIKLLNHKSQWFYNVSSRTCGYEEERKWSLAWFEVENDIWWGLMFSKIVQYNLNDVKVFSEIWECSYMVGCLCNMHKVLWTTFWHPHSNAWVRKIAINK